jgi:hypothetical protein
MDSSSVLGRQGVAMLSLVKRTAHNATNSGRVRGGSDHTATKPNDAAVPGAPPPKPTKPRKYKPGSKVLVRLKAEEISDTTNPMYAATPEEEATPPSETQPLSRKTPAVKPKKSPGRRKKSRDEKHKATITKDGKAR